MHTNCFDGNINGNRDGKFFDWDYWSLHWPKKLTLADYQLKGTQAKNLKNTILIMKNLEYEKFVVFKLNCLSNLMFPTLWLQILMGF